MTDYHKKAEQIISECIQFVFREDDPAKLALMFNVIKEKHHKEIEYIAQGLKDNVPAFVFKSMLTHELFLSRINEYSMGVNDAPYLEN